jgi:hypothetical protein
VAILTLDLVLAGVDIVPEKDRLARSLETPGVGGRENGGCDGIDGWSCLLRLRAGFVESEESSQTCGRNATDDECQLTHHHLTAEKKSSLALGQRAPKYSPRIGLNNPNDAIFRLIQSASTSSALPPR